MMDIVELLRTTFKPTWQELAYEAADEIEQLREHGAALEKTIRELQADNKKLRHEITVMTHGIEEETAQLRKQLAAVTKERDTLRMMVTSDCLSEAVCVDAERYRWIRKYCELIPYGNGASQEAQDEFDAGVDAAMRKEKEE